MEKKLSSTKQSAVFLVLLTIALGESTTAIASTTVSSYPVNVNHLSSGNSWELAQSQDLRSGKCRQIIGNQANPRTDVGPKLLAAFANPDDLVGGKIVASIAVGSKVTLANPYQEKWVNDPEGTGKVVMVAVTQAGNSHLLWIPVNRIKNSGTKFTTPSTLGLCTGSPVRGLW